MTLKEQLMAELEQVSDEVLMQEVLDFFLFLKSKPGKNHKNIEVIPTMQLAETGFVEGNNLGENSDNFESPLVHQKGGIWVVKAQGLHDTENWVNNLREGRMQEVGS